MTSLHTPIPSELTAAHPPRLWVVRLLSWAVFAVPFATSAFLLGLSPGWLHAPELVAAAGSLGLSHPPGHPAYVLSAHLASLLPLGSVAFRLALFSALCFGLTAWIAYRGLLQLCAIALGEACLTWRTRIAALLGVWLGCFQFSTMIQAVRPEVYAFHAVLAFAAIERLLAATRMARLQLSQARAHPWGLPCSPHRALLQAFLWIGLGLANHRTLTLLLVPGALVLVLWLWRSQVLQGSHLVMAFCLVLLGLSTYSYMPARSLQAPPIHWGAAYTPDTLGRQLMAQTWQRPPPTTQALSWGAKLSRISSIYTEQWGVWLVLAAIGLGLMSRLWWPVGLVVGMWLIAHLLSRLGADVQPQDLDLHGWLIVSMILIGWCVGFLAAWAVAKLKAWRFATQPYEAPQPIERNPDADPASDALGQFQLSRKGRVYGVYLAGLAGLLLMLLLPFVLRLEQIAVPEAHSFSLQRCDHRAQQGPLLWSRLMEEPLPYGTILVTSHFQHGFLRWYRHVIERHRPDIVLLQRNLLKGPLFSALERQRNSLLKGLDFAGKDPLAAYKQLKKSTSHRSVCFEWGDDLPKAVIRALYPIGAFFCWVPEREIDTNRQGQAKDDASIREQQQHFWREVYAMMKPIEHPTRAQTRILLRTHLQHARFYKLTGRWLSGLQEARLAMKLSPGDASVRALMADFIKRLQPIAAPPDVPED